MAAYPHQTKTNLVLGIVLSFDYHLMVIARKNLPTLQKIETGELNET
jgi:hypothetical protein